MKLTKFANVVSESGELLIIDPCYIEDFDREIFYNMDDKRFLGLLNLRGMVEHAKIENLLDNTRKLFECVKTDDDLDKFEKTEVVEKYKQDRHLKRLKKRKRNLLRQPDTCPPYIGQDDRYVIFHNTIGDGFYPIVQTEQDIRIIFNYPTKAVGKTGFDLDEERLHGTLLGRSAVYSATQIIIDPAYAKLDGIRPDLYCKLNPGKGKYSCRFLDENYSMSIKKIIDIKI